MAYAKNIEIIKQVGDNIFQLKNGKIECSIYFALNNRINVLVNNASNKAWKGFGRQFKNVDEAVAGYKSEAVKDMIRFVQDKVANACKVVQMPRN